MSWLDTVRCNFPQLSIPMRGRPLIYLDSGATALKPKIVIDKMVEYYSCYSANIHRGLYHLSERATNEFEKVRDKVKNFINAKSRDEIIFTRGTTEGLNLLAHSLGDLLVGPGDEVLITEMEHHSNIVPWQMLCERKQAVLRWIPMLTTGELDLANLEQLINDRTKIISLTYVSNSLGVINPVEKIIAVAKQRQIPVILDAAQAAPHLLIDVQALDCDFLAFSGHKLFGPTGVGVLYGKAQWLERMPPFLGGGDMIDKVEMAKSTYASAPARFEAGTPAVAEVIGLGAAIDFYRPLQGIAHQQEKALLEQARELLKEIPGLTLYGDLPQKISTISFTIEGVHPADIGTFLDREGIALRVGHHCTQPVMKVMGVTGTARASLSFYNTSTELEQFQKSLIKCRQFFI